MKGNLRLVGGRKKTILISSVALVSVVLLVYFLRSGANGFVNDTHHASPQAESDTSEVWALRDLAISFQSINPDSSIYYGRLGYQLASTLRFPAGRIWTLYQEARAHETKHDLESTFLVYTLAMNIAGEHDDHLSMAKLYNAIGATHYFAGNYPEAVANFTRAFALSDSLGYDEGKGHALNNLGIIYRLQRRYDRALDVYESSLEIKWQERDTVGIINTIVNMGIALSYMNDYEQSLAHFLEARQLAADLASPDVNLANIDLGIGVAYFNLNDGDQARRYLTTGIESIGDRVTAESVLGMTYLGSLDVREGRISRGLARIEEAYQLAAPSGRLELLRGILKERAGAATAVGNYPLATESWAEYTTLSDSLHTESRRWAQQELQARFELHEKEITITQQELQLQIESARKTRYFAIGISLAALLLLSFVFMRYIWRQREKLKKEVSIKEHALNENVLLLQEMHHRIKNNLQLLNSLLSLQSRNVTNQEARRALQSSRDTVGAIGLLHHQLYRSKDFRKVPLAPYVQDLSNYFNDAFSLKERNIELDYSCDPIDVDIDRAIPLGLIINELVTNAIKHAFDGRDQGTIHLNLKQDDDRITLEVVDNGAGVHNQSSENGTGKKLMKIFGHRLKATFDYLNSDAGTLARFSFPLNA